MTDKTINGHADAAPTDTDATTAQRAERSTGTENGAGAMAKPNQLTDTKVPDLLARIASRIADTGDNEIENEALGAMKARLEALKQQASDTRLAADRDEGAELAANPATNSSHHNTETRGTFAGVEAALAKLSSQVEDAEQQRTSAEPAEWNSDAAEALTAHCENEGLTGGRNKADLLVGDMAAKVDGAPVSYVYLQPSAQEIGQQWFEERFNALAERFDHFSLGDIGPGAGLGALVAKFDALEARFGTLFGYPTENGEEASGGSLHDIEMCIAEIAAQLEATTTELQRIDGIERQIGEIAQSLATGGRNPAGLEPFDMTVLADQVAERITQRPMAFANAGNSAIDDLDAGDLSSVMKEFMRERRAEGDHANAVLDTMQQTIIRVLDRMEALENSAPGRAPAPQQLPPQKATFAELEIAELDAPAAPKYAHETSSAQAEADDADARSLNRLQRVVGQLENTTPATSAEQHTPTGETAPAQPAAARIRAEFIAAAREAAALAANKAEPDETTEKVEAERSRFATAARNAAVKAGLRTAAQEDAADADMLGDGFAPGSTDMRPQPAAKTSNRARLLIAAVALLFVGIGATKYIMNQSNTAAGGTIKSDKVQQGSSVAGDKTTAEGATTEGPIAKVGSLPPGRAAPGQKAAADPKIENAQPAIVTSGTAGALVEPAAVPPGIGTTQETAPISSGNGGVARQALPSALVGPLSLRLAAANGDPSAEFQVGARFADGQGVEQNFGEAIKWYQRAAGRGFALAQYRLGTLYERGLGVAKDAQRARVWYERAAAKENIKSMHNLAVLAASPVNGKPDYETAAKWFNQAAERGLGDSQFNLAILYQNGLGVAQDAALAYKWFSLAAASGDGEAGKRMKGAAATLGKAKTAQVDAELRGWMRKPANRLANDPHYAGQAWQRS